MITHTHTHTHTRSLYIHTLTLSLILHLLRPERILGILAQTFLLIFYVSHSLGIGHVNYRTPIRATVSSLSLLRGLRSRARCTALRRPTPYEHQTPGPGVAGVGGWGTWYTPISRGFGLRGGAALRSIDGSV
jgi:hypothetical protein